MVDLNDEDKHSNLHIDTPFYSQISETFYKVHKGRYLMGVCFQEGRGINKFSLDYLYRYTVTKDPREVPFK